MSLARTLDSVEGCETLLSLPQTHWLVRLISIRMAVYFTAVPSVPVDDPEKRPELRFEQFLHFTIPFAYFCIFSDFGRAHNNCTVGVP